MTRRRHLLDHLPQAELLAPPGYVEAQPVTLMFDRRLALFQHPDSETRLGPFPLGADPVLSFSCGMKMPAWGKAASAVTFTVAVAEGKGRAKELFSFRLDPRNPGHQRWIPAEVSLARWAGKTVTLALRTEVPRKGRNAWCWTAWADPVLRDEAPTQPPRPFPCFPRPPVVLVTFDALRADACDPASPARVGTPHLDRLAGDGTRFTHARAQTGTTLGSYATLLSGRHADAHRLLAEWGTFPAALPALPGLFAAAGYRTLFAPGERELGDAAQGFAPLFGEALPCLAQPAQDGETTVRRVLAALDSPGDGDPRPPFLWVQLFDTHPPQFPPRRFRDREYPGDPTAPSSAYGEEALARVRGIESLQDILMGLPHLEAGRPDPPLAHRLLATAEALSGRASSGPDLVAHLRGLGERAWGGRTLLELAGWLERGARELAAGRVEPELTAWLVSLIPLLREVEADVLAGLVTVRDHRFVTALYRASVSSADSVLGLLLEGLRERGLYDQALVAVTAPHGELLGEKGVHFHHHLLAEPALRVPLVIKPPAGAARGTAVEGVFDLLDLAPTLLGGAGVPVPASLEGRSRWPQVLEGGAIPEHDSFAVDRHALSLALVRGGWKLLLPRESFRLSEDYSLTAGEPSLFHLPTDGGEERDLAGTEPGRVREMREALEGWAERRGW